MERLVTDSFRAVGSRIDPKRISNCFEIFGYDFMIDENFKVYLIEANTNPCLEICSPLLARIIPELLDNSFRIALDPLYQPAQFLAKLKEDMTGPATEASSRIEPGGGAPRETTIGLNTLRDRAMASEVKGAVNECDYQMSPVGKKKDTGAAGTAKAYAAGIGSKGYRGSLRAVFVAGAVDTAGPQRPGGGARIAEGCLCLCPQPLTWTSSLLPRPQLSQSCSRC